MGDDRLTPPDPIRRRVPTLKGPAVAPRPGPAPLPREERSDDPETARQLQDLEAQNAELQAQLTRAAGRQQESVAPSPPKSAKGEEIRVQGRGWGLTVPSVVVSAVLTIIITRCSAQPPPPPTKEVEVYAALRDEVIRVNESQRAQAADLAELRAWIKGYLQATGVKVVDPPGAAIEPKTVELAPAPLLSPHKPGRAPDVQVRTPLPAPRPVPAPVQLPEDIRALPKPP